MAARAGYTLVVYVVDISPSMGTPKADPGDSGVKRPRLDWAKEFVARQCEPKIQSGRKTEAVGLVTFGGRTNNQANRAWMTDHPEDEQPPYMAVSSEVAIQTAKPKTLEVLMNLDIGEHPGNPVSALMVALDMIETHKHTKAWSLEIVLLTDGESEFEQEEYEEATDRLDKLGVKLSVVGIDFQDPTLPVEKDKPRTKRLSEKFWRAFVQQLHDRVSQTSDFEKFLPRLSVLDPELVEARRPHAAVVNGTVSGTVLYIGAKGVDEDQAISIPIKYSKATMKARPPTLSKAWKAAVDMQQPTLRNGTQASQLMSQLAEQSQSAGNVPPASDLAAMISSDVKRYSTYIIKHKTGGESATQATQMSQDPDILPMPSATQEATQEEVITEEVVDKEDLVKAWRFGSSWVPMEADTFEPLHTQKGVEVLGFIPKMNLRKYMLIGEVRYVWPDITSPKAQIEFSSFVQALVITDLVAIVRWVLKDDAEPNIGVCIPQQDFQGTEDDPKVLDLMYWIKLPFADDDHKFWFPSLTKYKTAEGKEVTEHPYIPTQEQCDLMDEFVKKMDLDDVLPPGVEPAEKTEKDSNDDEEDEEDDEEMLDKPTGPWFNAARSLNPVIHRIKEAIFHASLSSEDDPLGPPHPELVQYFNTPDELVEATEKITEQLKTALDIKKVTPRTRKKVQKEGLREDEGYLDIDDLFDGPDPAAVPTQVKSEVTSPSKPKVEDEDVKPKVETQAARPKPKRGRLVSNEQPLEDFRRLVDGEGDMFKKAIQDLGAVVKENVAASFSRSAFLLAIECLEAMRETALMYEEVETYNAAVESLENAVKEPGFKHPDFWDHFEKAGSKVAPITEEEASQALEEDYD